MRNIQICLDEHLIRAIDKIVKRQKTTRSALTRHALRSIIERFNNEIKHRKGYKTRTVKKNEFSVWEDEQAWLD